MRQEVFVAEFEQAHEAFQTELIKRATVEIPKQQVKGLGRSIRDDHSFQFSKAFWKYSKRASTEKRQERPTPFSAGNLKVTTLCASALKLGALQAWACVSR